MNPLAPLPANLQRTQFELAGHVAVITLHYPEKLNAWGPVMEAEVKLLLRHCEADPQVRAILLTGSGRAFCAGADMGAMQAAADGASPPPRVEASPEGDFEQRYSYLLSIPKPIVCAINGAAAGVGLVLAMFCDIRYAAESAKLVPVFARRGLVAEHGLAWLLPKIIGLSDALEWLMSGRPASAPEALHMRAVSAVLPDAYFRDEAIRRVQQLAAESSPRSLGIIKRQVYRAQAHSLAQAVHDADAELPACIASEDFKEGVSHFVEKRAARFTGR